MTTSAHHPLPPASIASTATKRTGAALRAAFALTLIASAAALAPYPGAAAPMAVLAGMLCAIFLARPIAGVASHVWGPVVGAATLLVLSQAHLSRLGLEVP